jgi:hypothetical protein
VQPLTWLLQQIGSVRMRWTSGGAVRAAASATASERGVRRAGVEESVKRVEESVKHGTDTLTPCPFCCGGVAWCATRDSRRESGKNVIFRTSCAVHGLGLKAIYISPSGSTTVSVVKYRKRWSCYMVRVAPLYSTRKRLEDTSRPRKALEEERRAPRQTPTHQRRN